MPIINEKWRENLLNVGLLVLRVVFCGLLLSHGLPKLIHFSDTVSKFPDPIGLGHWWSGVLVIFAEVVCALAVLLGFLTRLAIIPMIISMSVAFFIFHANDPFKVRELPLLYLTIFWVLLLTGPGRFSIDGLLMRRGGR